MSRGWLLDTNVVSELRRPRPSAQVVAWVSGQPLDRLYTSTVVLAEIRFGIEQVGDSGKRAALADWLAHKLRPQFDGRILQVSEEVMLKWRVLVEAGRKAGHTYSQPDLIIAATAMQHGLVLVTRNTADVARTGVELFDPWAARGGTPRRRAPS